MGNQNSTSSTQETHQLHQINGNNNSMESGPAHDPELRSMRRSLKKDQEAFILNNLMLCVQFFENYEREIQEIRSSPGTQRENDLNRILSQSQKHILLPGTLEEQMSRHVKFSSKRMTDSESTIEPLQPIRMHVVLDNVNVKKIVEKSNPSTASPDPIFYKTRLEPSCNLGYVRLRSLGVKGKRKEQILESTESDLPFIVEDEDEIYHKEEDMSNPRINPGVRILSRVEKRASTMSAKQTHTQSMSELDSVDGINEEAATLGVNRTHSDDEGYQESSSCSGISECRLSGPLKASKQPKMRLQHHSRSLESIPRSSRSSSYKSGSSEGNLVAESDSDYSYGTTSSSTMSESSMSRENLPVLTSEIPVSCFKKFVCTLDGKPSVEKAKRTKPRTPGEKRIRKAEECQTEERSYLRSRKFRRYFEDLFLNQLAKPLGFEIEDDNDVSRQGAIIHCYAIKEVGGGSTLVVPHEIVPSVSARGSDFCRDFVERSRRAQADYPTRKTWVTKKMVDEVEPLDCHIIPESYKPSRNADPYHAVEWQLTFPLAERYLETCLSHSQAHVYMVALMLRRTFIRSTDPTFGLTKSHIRSQLFWLLEEGCSSSTWRENRGGESLMELLKKLYTAVSMSQPCLPDYFISKKNLFANVPRQYLHLTQKQIRRIIDNPVMYLIAAMQSIRYKPEFFPVMDYKRLYQILTVHDGDLLALIRPDQAREDVLEKYEQRFSQITGLRDTVKTKEDALRDAIKKPDHLKSPVNESKSNSHEDLVIQITDECAELHGLRLTTVLEMFIEHFTKMAEHCHQYDAMRQKDVYLNQAHRLSIILQDQSYGKDDAKRYLDAINTLRNKLSRFGTGKNEPGTSGRSEKSPVSVPLNQYFTDGANKGQGVASVGPDAQEANKLDVHHTHV